MNSMLQLLQQIIAGRQNNRILRLSFPNMDGPNAQLLVNRIEADESLSRHFEFTLELLSDSPTLELKSLLGKLFSVELVRRDGSLRYFSGYCFAFGLIKSDGGVSYYQAKLGPWLQYLSIGKNNYLFHGKTLQEQTDHVFRSYGASWEWECRIAGSDPVMTDACQFDESNCNYLSRRWEAAGWLYWYEHSADGHRLILSDDSTAAASIDCGPDIAFQSHGGAGEEDGISQWSALGEMQPTHVTAARFDFKRPLQDGFNISTSHTISEQGEVLGLEMYEYVGALGFRNAKDGDRLTRLRMEEFEVAAKQVRGAGNNRCTQPGRRFRLTGHFRDLNDVTMANSSFLVVDVRHVATNNYLSPGEELAKYANTFHCIDASVPWRPSRGFNSVDTKVLAPQTATVVGPAGPDSIHTDAYGRIRVQFHWDREGVHDEKSSTWVRVSSPWAGAQLGAAAVPRVSSEVVVQFLGGNPDRPIVTGSLYNEYHMPPWDLPTQQALTGFRSRELAPNGGNAATGRSNHLLLDDTNGRIQAQLKSDHQHSQLSLGHITRVEDCTGRKDARGEGWELTSNAWGVARAGQGLLLTTEGRPAACSTTKDMAETVRRLEIAHELQQTQANFAEQAGVHEKAGSQADVAAAVQAQNRAIQGADGPFPELAEPHIVLSSPAGVAVTSARTTHLASGSHTALTAGKHIAISSGDSLFASIANTFRLLVHRAGMKLVAAAGDIDIQALSDSINLLSKLNITQTANRITITAKEEIIINGGGSYVQLNAQGIEQGTSGAFTGHAASHSFLGPKNLTTPDMPVVQRVQVVAKLKLSI